MSDELERKIEDKKLQLGSLNDELNTTIRQVNHLHEERENLLAENDVLVGQKRQAREDILKARDTLSAILLDAKSAKEGHEKNNVLMQTQFENARTASAHQQELLEKEIERLQSVKSVAFSAKKEMENEVISITSRLKIVQEDEMKQTRRIKQFEAQIKELLRSLSTVESKNTSAEKQQEKLVSNIQYQETVLRNLVDRVDKHRQSLSVRENMLYAIQEAISYSNTKLKELTNTIS